MPSPKRPGVKPAELRNTFRTDLAASWNRFKELHPDHTPYAFVLYGVEGTPQLTPHVLTEESLAQVAQRYLQEGAHDTLEDARKALRFSVPDSPLFNELEPCFSTVNSLLEPHLEKLEETTGYDSLAKAAMDAFQSLDKEKLFGTGRKREQLLLLIITEDTEKDWSTPSAKRLNSAAAFKRFQDHNKLEGPFVRCNDLTISPDGRSLYLTGSREIDPEKEETISEIVACDIKDLRLRRRWSFSFPHFGDSGRAIACSQNGDTVVVLRGQYVGESPYAPVMQFGKDSKAVLKQQRLKGEPAAMALSHDDSRLAIGMHEETLHFLDRELQPVKVLVLDSTARSLHFLKSGELLVATDYGIVRVNNNFDVQATAHRRPAFHIVADAAEKLLVVARWFTLTSGGDKEEFGIEILSLPSLERERTILIPGHQLVTPAISPDGRYAAYHVHEIGKHRRFIAVLDTATGREIARRKCLLLDALSFLPDNQTLAIGSAEHTKAEAVTLWRVPGL